MRHGPLVQGVIPLYRPSDCSTIVQSFVPPACRVPFQLTASRNDYLHALVGYFDVTFSAGHKPVVMTTSPKARPTHWKQTVFYLEEPLTICAGGGEGPGREGGGLRV